jgi:hypothetical protein
MEEIVLKKIAICDIILSNVWHPNGCFFYGKFAQKNVISPYGVYVI